MTQFLQINLHRSYAAQQLMYATAAELGSQVLLVSEQPPNAQNNRRWSISNDNTCAIAMTTNAQHIIVEEQGAGVGFVWIRSGQLKIFSCYLSPNSTRQEFNVQLGALEEANRTWN
jgi:hypothetical protein